IELGEIESQLQEHEAVGEAVVVVREGATDAQWDAPESEGERAGRAQPGTPAEKRLVAYVTAKGPRGESSGQASTELTADSLRTYLGERVPPYMVPAAFVVLPRLPLTSNGKVDRQALPEPSAESYRRGQYEPPQGEIEQALAQIWQELLQVEQVGRQDDFFALGGHSLLALRVIARIRHEFDIDLPLRGMFERSTLADMANSIIDVLLEGQDASVVASALVDLRLKDSAEFLVDNGE